MVTQVVLVKLHHVDWRHWLEWSTGSSDDVGELCTSSLVEEEGLGAGVANLLTFERGGDGFGAGIGGAVVTGECVQVAEVAAAIDDEVLHAHVCFV